MIVGIGKKMLKKPRVQFFMMLIFAPFICYASCYVIKYLIDGIFNYTNKFSEYTFGIKLKNGFGFYLYGFFGLELIALCFLILIFIILAFYLAMFYIATFAISLFRDFFKDLKDANNEYDVEKAIGIHKRNI